MIRKEEKAGKAKMVRNEFSNAHLQIIAFFHAKRSDKKEKFPKRKVEERERERVWG